MLRNGFYLYEHMGSWQKFNETSLPKKKDFYINLNMEYVTDVDYKQRKKKYGKILKQKI